MRKGLLASSALVGASIVALPAMAATPTVGDAFGVTIAGTMRSTFIWYDQNQRDSALGDVGRGYRFAGNDESEVYFRARGKADNGLAYGFDIEIQTQTDNANGGGEDFNADEVWSFIDSPMWGRIEIGDQDDAADRIMIDGADAQAGRGGNNFSIDTGGMVVDHGGTAGTALDSAGITRTGDASKIIYFTPRWSGFQIGLSFTPDTGMNGGIATNDQGAPGSTCSSATPPVCQSPAADFEDVFALGLSYQNTFSGVGVILAGTYQTGTSVRSSGTAAALEDLEIWGLGAQLKYAGFTFAAGYANHGETGITKALASDGQDAGQWWNIGLMYTTGPWDFSVGYFSGWADAANGAADNRDMTHQNVAVSATYRVAPGWVLAGDIIWFDMNNRTPTTANLDDVDGFMFVLSSTLTF